MECDICYNERKTFQCHLGCNYKMCEQCYFKILDLHDFKIAFKCPQCRRLDVQVLWSVKNDKLNQNILSSSYIDKKIIDLLISNFTG